MKTEQEILRGGINPEEYPRISHTICLDDFNTNYPNTRRVDRIASEINEYLKRKNKYANCNR